MPLLLANRAAHHPQAGLNPLVDAAGFLFSLLDKLHKINSYQELTRWHEVVSQGLQDFQKAIQPHYANDILAMSRYAMCALIDDILSRTIWERQWKRYRLLDTLPTEMNQPGQFFFLLNRIVKQPVYYIDLMELMYICLSLGYKNQMQHHELQLDQIKNHLYQHIRTYRGNRTKVLSLPLKKPVGRNKTSHKFPLFLIFMTVCVITAIFVAFGHLRNVITHDSFQQIAAIEQAVSKETG